MATTENLETVSKVTAADLSALQFTWCILNSAGLAAAAGAGVNGYGVLMNKAPAGAAATVGISGVAKCKAGAALTAGTKLMIDASGRVITATSGNHVVATAGESAAAANEIISITIHPGPKEILA